MIESPQTNLQINAIEILPKIIGNINTARFFPTNEKVGIFNNINAQPKPKVAKIIEDTKALRRVFCNVLRKDPLLTSPVIPLTLISPKNGKILP